MDLESHLSILELSEAQAGEVSLLPHVPTKKQNNLWTINHCLSYCDIESNYYSYVVRQNTVSVNYKQQQNKMLSTVITYVIREY